MSNNIQKTLDSLQPYVISIRYLEGSPVVDVVFKEGWSVLDETNIQKIKGDDSMNYYMLLSDDKHIGLDGLLGYVDKVIKYNQEREKKHDLLKVKVNELKEIFKKTPLKKLNTLKFRFAEEDLVPSLNEFDLDIDEELPNSSELPSYEEETVVDEPIGPDSNYVPYLDENGDAIELSDEEREILAEEARAEHNMKIMENRKNKKKETPKPKVELPPKPKMVLENHFDSDSDCDCGPNEACAKCIDSKDY